MNILIIGGAGYIGSHVAREFLDAGHRVTVYDNLSSGLRQNIFRDEQFIHGDILQKEQLSAVCRGAGFDALVHLAALKAAGESALKPEQYSVYNICGSINILNAALEAGIKYVLFSSSATVYGEPDYLPIDEHHPVRPANYYGFTKLEIERIMAWYDKLKGIRFASLRYFNAAGYDIQNRITGIEMNPTNLIPVIMEAACGIRSSVQIFGTDYKTPDGTGVRDYVHVNDLALGHLAALDYISLNDKSLTVNLGSEKGFSVLEIIEAARRITGRRIVTTVVERRTGDPAILMASAQYAKESLAWTAHSSDLETLLDSTWKVYQN
ncbi:MAG: UDP-glucose 4-epimerase GalE [Spirochaetaceae bacterium]|jgi:UDP-glucose 4-epimerase|nr:UDP-glucose 4-epimerase GalE [Spirochaetaceae bacterium]